MNAVASDSLPLVTPLPLDSTEWYSYEMSVNSFLTLSEKCA